jgi:hypothetical protein
MPVDLELWARTLNRDEKHNANAVQPSYPMKKKKSSSIFMED